MTIARVDCPAGASGNMFLGALLDAGLDQAKLEAELRTLDLPPWRLVRQAVRKGPIAATHMDFDIDAAGGHRTLSDPESMAAVIAASGVREPAKARAQRMVGGWLRLKPPFTASIWARLTSTSSARWTRCSTSWARAWPWTCWQ